MAYRQLNLVRDSKRIAFLGTTGINGALIPSGGENGPGLLYDYLPGDKASHDYQCWITSEPASGTFFCYNDSSFTLIGAADGVYTVGFDIYEDGVFQSSETESITVGDGSSISVNQTDSEDTSTLAIAALSSAQASQTDSLDSSSFSLNAQQAVSMSASQTDAQDTSVFGISSVAQLSVAYSDGYDTYSAGINIPAQMYATQQDLDDTSAYGVTTQQTATISASYADVEDSSAVALKNTPSIYVNTVDTDTLQASISPHVSVYSSYTDSGDSNNITLLNTLSLTMSQQEAADTAVYGVSTQQTATISVDQEDLSDTIQAGINNISSIALSQLDDEDALSGGVQRLYIANLSYNTTESNDQSLYVRTLEVIDTPALRGEVYIVIPRKPTVVIN